MSQELVRAAPFVQRRRMVAVAGYLRVLVAEDEPVSRLRLVRTIEQLGHEVLIATDGVAAWEMFAAQRADVVVTDWMMPGLDGPELCRRIRADTSTPYTYVIFTTTMAGRDNIRDALSVGADDYLVKPIAAEDIEARLIVAQRVTSLHHERAQALAERDAMLQALQTLADTDPLTELANRRRATDVLKRYLSVARRRGHHVSLAVVDIDHFKHVNDSYGHPAGDAVLRGLGTLLTRTFRGEDVVARWGGDEFVVGLYDTPRETAMARLAQVQQELRRTVFTSAEGIGFSVTFSAGMAESPDDGDDLLMLFGAADATLYEAKDAGRDHIVGTAWHPARPT